MNDCIQGPSRDSQRRTLQTFSATLRAQHARIVAGLVCITTIALGCGGGGSGQSGGGANQPLVEPLMQLELTARENRAVWGMAEDDLFVGGGSDFVVHYDGQVWEIQSFPVRTLDVAAIWGTASDNVYAVALNRILHFDGTEWQVVFQTNAELLDIWGSSPDDIHAVGVIGTALHYDGETWSPLETGVAGSLRKVEGLSANQVYATGGNGDEIIRFDGFTWSPQQISSAASVNAVAAHASGRVFLADSDGALFVGPGNFADFRILDTNVRSISAVGRLELIGSDLTGDVFRWANNVTEWFTFPGVVRETWASDFGDTYTIGGGGQIILHDGVEFMTLREARTPVDLTTVFGARDGTLFALGQESYAFLDGEWQRNDVNPAAQFLGGSAVSREYAIAVGRQGVINHWDGSEWSFVRSPTTTDLTDAWAFNEANSFAVGSQGEILYDNGAVWSIIEDLRRPLDAVHGTAPNDVFVCGSSGDVFHSSGQSWESMQTPTSARLRSIWAVSASDVFAVGDDRTVIRYDGNEWAVVPTTGSGDFLRVWASGPDKVFALTDAGTILWFDGSSFVPFATLPREAGADLFGTQDSLVSVGGSTTIVRVGL